MKKITSFVLANLIICLLFTLQSCDTRPIDRSPKYFLEKTTIIPDSLKEKQRQWIKETVSATNLHMTAGDYEDPEDVIETATASSFKIFGVDVYTLQRKNYGEDHYNIVEPNLLSPKEKVILQNLINQ